MLQNTKAAAGGNPNSPDEAHGDDHEELQHRLQNELRQAQLDADKFTKNDQTIKRKDTVEVVVDILNRIKATADEVNKLSQELRERLYHITFNATVIIYKLTRILRESSFSKEATHFLAFNVLCLDNNLILTTAKYLDWRVMNYVELARAYADLAAFKAATRVVAYGIQKVLYLKQIEEQDPPVPDGTKETLVEALRVLRTQELKYQLQSGALTPDAWKKKVEETYNQNKYHRSLCIVECLNTNDPLNCRQIQRSAKMMTVKSQSLKLALDLVKTDIDLIKQALIQIHEKKKRDREKKETLANKDSNPDLNVDEFLEKHKILDQEMIKEKDWKFASYNVPIELHVELLKMCFECKMWSEFDLLLDPALIRLKFRRYEVPYLATVDVLMSANKTANIPNGFEKIPKDLNQANLKIELKKLRQQAKLAGISEGKPKEEDKKKEEKKAPAQPPPAAKPDPKAAAAKGGKPDPKAAQPAAQVEIPKDEEDEGQIQASEAELERIKHVYVNVLLQRTKNSQNAIVGLDIVLADENVGPDLQDNHFAVAVPIRQHHGVYEKTKLIPYVVFRRTANGLIDEQDSLSIITDVQVIMGQDAHLRAPLGYQKIPIDLRQTPKDLERVPNLDYVYLCYKTDKPLAQTERDLLVFRRLADLEKSYVEKANAANANTDEYKSFLGINYNMEMLVDLSRTVKEALLGPLGDFYMEQRQDVLFDLTCLLWSKYLLPILQKIDLYTEMRHQREYPIDFITNMDELIIQVKNNFCEAFNIMHRILTRMNFVEDMIMYSKFAIYLGSLQEELGEFRNAVQTLRAAIGKIVEYREERLKMSLDSKDNVRTSMSITVDNKKIGDLETKILAVYEAWEQMILRKERDRDRREKEALPLEEDEGDEEQAEVQKCIEELKNKDLFEKGINHEEWRKTMKIKNTMSGVKYFSEQEQIVHSLHCDLLLNLYRCEIKLGKEMQMVKTQTSKLLQTQGIDLSKHAPGNLTKNLSTSLNQKMNQTKSNKTLAKAKGDLQTLKQTLQEAGKLPPPKPQIQSYEKLLEKENHHNAYQNALLQMCLAVAKTNIVEQKSLLLEAIELLQKAKAQEDQLSNLSIENAIYIKAAQYYHDYYKRSADQVHPFHLMGQQQYIKKSPVPMKPIFISRTSTSMMLKLPFYKPITEYKSWRNIGSMALFGKPSGSGVGVSLNNTEYDGTGEKQQPGALINVTGLIPHEKYVFAAGGYTADGICVNGIGETSNEIVALLPLSLHQLYGYLAEISYKLGHYQIAKQAAETLCSQFIEKNDLKYSFLDARVNPILAFKLNTSYLSLISPIEAKQLAESFLILARVSKVVRSDTQRRADTHELKVEKQKVDMKIANYLIVALDISLAINQAVMTKRVVSELFNHLVPYFEMNLRPHLMFQVLFKCHQACRLIPQDLIDSNLRRVIGCLSYQIMRLGFEYAEDDNLKRVMLSELPQNTRRWRKYIQYHIKRPELTEEQKLKQQEQKQKLAAGELIGESELIKDPEPFEEKTTLVKEFELEGQGLEEFLLSLIDYQDLVKAKTERWKLQINKFQKQIPNESVDKLKEELTSVVEFWEGIKVNNPAQQLQAILGAFDPANPNPKYLEFCCKSIRRSMELGLQTFAELEEILQNKVKLGSAQVDELVGLIESKVTERTEYLDKDIVRKQRKRFQVLEEKVQQLQEDKSMSGGNKVTDIEKLMETLNGQIQATSGADEDYFGCVPFDNDVQEKFATYNYLWISEKLLLQGMCTFLSIQSSMAQRSQLQLLNQNSNGSGGSCVFNDILQLDFSKSKQAMDDQGDKFKQLKQAFDEENKDANAHFTYRVEDRVTKMTNFLRIMAKAAEYAKQARAWLQLENIIRYTWNAFSYDLTTPLELKDTEGWKYVVQISEASVQLMEKLKQNGGRGLRKTEYDDIDELKNQKPVLANAGKSVAFQMHIASENGEETKVMDNGTPRSTSQSTSGGGSGKALKWFEKIANEFDVTIHASFVAFGVQALMAVGKWESLVDLSNRLNDATVNTFAQQLLPFIIYAQTTLYQEAALKTLGKRNELQARCLAFEQWKLTSKKKRSRQAMITGEIPLEEQEFLRDKAQLEKEIFRLEIIENVLKMDKEKSEGLLYNIMRDANACEESLKQCRKLYFQFGVETQSLRIEELKKGGQHFEIKTKKKGHKVYTSMVISNYKKCVELLRKRQEKFMLIQALHELGNLLYSDGQLGEAEIQWNDCVDTIFQKLYVVNSFRTVFKENPGPALADTFGSKQCLIGGVVLTKLAKLCYEGRDLHRFNECLLMASELFAAPGKLNFPHPQTAIEFNQYRIREFLSEQLFMDKYVITPSELLHTLGSSAQALLDADMPEKSLAVSSLMEYIASDISRSKLLTVKSRLLKAIGLTEIGFINEAYQLYNRILSLKDLPKIGARDSDFLVKKEGKNFYFPYNQRYHNHLPPENEKNQEAIQNISKAVAPEVIAALKKFSSPYVIELLQYLRCSLLVRIGESENVELPAEKQEMRNQLLKAAEESLRQGILKNVQINEEVGYLKDKLEQLSLKQIDIPEQEIADAKARLAKCYETYAITTEEDQKVFYSNKEEEMCYGDRRSQFMNLLLRGRMMLGRIQAKQGLLVNAFYIYRQGLTNFKNFAEGKHTKIETGLESEDKGTFRLPEIYGGTGLGAAAAPVDPKAKAPAPAKAPPPDPKKGAPAGKGGPPQAQQDEEEAKKQEEERKKREAEDEKKELAKIEAAEKRDHPNMYLWLKTKLEIIQILFHQRRFEDCSDAISITRLECNSINDLFFARQLMEVEFMMEIYRGELEPALRTAEKIRKHASAYYQSDINFSVFLGNFAEFLYNRDHRSECTDIAKEGRTVVWLRLRDFGIDLDPQNINFKHTDVKINKARVKPNEEVLAQYQSAVAQPAGGKGAPAKAAAPAKGAPAKGAPGGAPAQEDLPVEEEKVEAPLDFTQKIEYPLNPADGTINSTFIEPNIYLRNLELAVRFDVRYAQFLTMLPKQGAAIPVPTLQQHDLAKRILVDTEKLTKRTLHLSPMLRFYVQYLLGQTNLKIFYESVLEFQAKYHKNNKYKDSLTKHIPYGSIALGNFMLELPNFSHELKGHYKEYLDSAKKALKQAVDIGRSESIVYEFDFSIVDALRSLSEVCFLQMEYRARSLKYKYAKYKELDMARKLAHKIQQKKDLNESFTLTTDDNLALQEEIKASKDEWEEAKITKEKIEVANARRWAVYYLDACVQASRAQREFADKQHLLSSAQAALVDTGAKLPREVASEMFETAQVTKVNYVKVPDFEPKDKTAITPAEVLAYLKALAKELEFMTFGEEKTRQSKLISKLHRYLKVNLPTSYGAKCSLETTILAKPEGPEEFKEVASVNTADNNVEGYLQRSKIIGKWQDFKGQKSQFFYIIGPGDETLINTLYVPPAQDPTLTDDDLKNREEERKENLSIHMGTVEVDSLVLSALYQEVRDLADKMKNSEKNFSAAQNERDRKGYRVKFNQLIERFGNIFKPPLDLNSMDNPDELLNDGANCMDLFTNEGPVLLPDLTVDNVDKLAQLLQKDSGCLITDPKFNTIVRRFHRVRYIK